MDADKEIPHGRRCTFVEMNGEDDHVHLFVEYPPIIAITRLVNSLKGVSSRLLRTQRPDITRRYWRTGCGALHMVPPLAVVHP